MRGLLLPVIATLVAALATAAAPSAALAANPAPPGVTTGAAKAIGLTTATVPATVDPNGAATTFHVEYGTSASYGLATADRSAGSGDAAVTTDVPLTGLTSDTTYHYRVVATNAAGKTNGGDRTLRTTAPATPPAVATGATRTTRATSTTLTGTIDTRGLATSWYFEYGTSARYGSRTTTQSATGSGRRTVTAGLTGLKPYTKYYYRLVGTNAAGTTRGANRTVTTLRAPTGITLSAPSPRVPTWSGSVTLSGRVTGTAVGGVGLAVQRQDFPYTAAVWIPKTFTADKNGRFTVTVGPLWSAVRLRVVTRTTIVVAGPQLVVANRERVGASRVRTTSRTVTLSGAVQPAAPGATVSVQRLTSRGRWIRVKRTKVRGTASGTSRYRVSVRRLRRDARMRVVVVPDAAGGHVRGISRELVIRHRTR